MRGFSPPFKFDFDKLVATARRKLNNRVDGITISFPFVSVSVCPDDLEQQVAREIVIRMADRRVLNSSECCDNCIDQALESLQKIRQLLVDQQVKLSKATDGPLYLMIEFMLESIRQFLTFEQRLRAPEHSQSRRPEASDFRRPRVERESYFAALEMLRGHLYRCLTQVAAIAKVQIPKIGEGMRYAAAWQMEAYKSPPAFPE
jgi:hypothetical protein